MRRWWNLKETDLLDRIVEVAPAVRLGLTATAFADPEPTSPARRVFELLFLRGTLPEQFSEVEVDPWVLPLLDDELEAAILDAFQARTDDPPTPESGDRGQLAAFLAEHKGSQVLISPRGEGGEAELGSTTADMPQ
ncbi:MAG: hypothetical protein HOU81_08155 [Hamadaea sp.]|nr:hypothetical protein [Hamadaea sp.]NUT24221.1 hypothetical protein [Hamadaea sp.]